MPLRVLLLLLLLRLRLPLCLLHRHQDVPRATLSHHLHHVIALQLREGRLPRRLGAIWPKLRLTLTPLLHLNLNLLHLL